MARKKRPAVALIDRALEAFEGRLVSVKRRTCLKVTSGTWHPATQLSTPPVYIQWEPGELAVFIGLGKSGRSTAGNTRGWAQIMLKGQLGFMQPSQLRHLILEEDATAPTA